MKDGAMRSHNLADFDGTRFLLTVSWKDLGWVRRHFCKNPEDFFGSVQTVRARGRTSTLNSFFVPPRVSPPSHPPDLQHGTEIKPSPRAEPTSKRERSIEKGLVGIRFLVAVDSSCHHTASCDLCMLSTCNMQLRASGTFERWETCVWTSSS